MMFAYNCNVPMTTFVNLIPNSVIEYSVVNINESGSPAKNRGMYFDGEEDAYIYLDNFVISHSYAYVIWCLSFPGWRGTLFHKETHSLVGAENDFMFAKVISQELVDNSAEVSTGQASGGDWGLISYEFEMVNGDQTEIRFWYGLTLTGTITVTNFATDVGANTAYVGLQRTGSGGFVNRFYGYIFCFAGKQGDDGQPARDILSNAGTHDQSTMWTVQFDQYQDENGDPQPCDATCAGIGCINDRPCREDCKNGHEWCHLCLDYECQTCTTYDNCEIDSCDEHAERNGDECQCITGYGRLSIDDECVVLDCIDGCEVCTTPDDFSGCLGCTESYVDISPDGTSYFYCYAECPTNFDSNCNFSESFAMMFAYNCNVPSTTFANLTPNSVIEYSVVNINTSGSPAKNRGMYFDGQEDAYIQVNNFVISHSYAYVIWCLSFRGWRGTLFHKVEHSLVGAENDVMFAKVLSQALVDNSAEVSTGQASGGGDWGLISYEFEMVNGDQTEIRFWYGLTLTGKITVNNFAIDVGANTAYVGIQRTGSGGFVNRFYGYVYCFAGKQGDDGQPARDILSNADTHDQSTMWTVQFHQYQDENGDAQPCDATCAGIGCINDRPCREDCKDGHEWCHLCLDYECQKCTTYDTCELGACDEHAERNGDECQCIKGWGRIDIDDECQECYGACETCMCDCKNGCLTCDEVDRTLAGPPLAECICVDGKFPNPDAINCSDCDDACATCYGGAAHECLVCAAGRYTWKTSDAEDASILCFSEIPSGYTVDADGNLSCPGFMVLFNWWPRQDLLIEMNGITVDGRPGFEPVPVYGRGLYFAGNGEAMQISNLNVGTEHLFHFWYLSYSFYNLFSCYGKADGFENQELFSVTSDGGSNIVIYLRNVDGTFYSYTSSGDANFNRDGEWNSLWFSLIAQRDESREGRPFGTTLQLELNDLRPIKSAFFEGVYMEDVFSNVQRAGSGGTGPSYTGYIA